MEIIGIGALLIIAVIAYSVGRSSIISERDTLQQEKNVLQYDKQLLQAQIQAVKSVSIDPARIVPQEVHSAALKEKNAELEMFKAYYNSLNASYEELQKKHEEYMSKKKSGEVRLGMISENLIPFLDGFKHDPKNMVAIFRPVDYLVFNENELIFLEVKTGNAQQSAKQKNIERIIKEGRVRYEIHRLNEEGYKIKE